MGKISSNHQYGMEAKAISPARRSPWTKFQEAHRSRRQTNIDSKQQIRSAIKLRRVGMTLDSRSMRICFPSKVALLAPRKAIQSTPCLSRSSPQTRPKEKKLRKIIWAAAKAVRKPINSTSTNLSILPRKWTILLKLVETDKFTFSHPCSFCTAREPSLPFGRYPWEEISDQDQPWPDRRAP